MNKWWRILPLWLLWLDMMYGFVLNLASSLSLGGGNLPKSGLPVAPEIAFSWLQVLVNGVIITIISWALWTLRQLHRTVVRQQPWPLGMTRILALATLLAFSLPAWWHWLWALGDLLLGRAVVDWHNPRYLATALLLLYPAPLCLWCLFWRRKQQSGHSAGGLN